VSETEPFIETSRERCVGVEMLEAAVDDVSWLEVGHRELRLRAELLTQCRDGRLRLQKAVPELLSADLDNCGWGRKIPLLAKFAQHCDGVSANSHQSLRRIASATWSSPSECSWPAP